jgi:hypothetical protein
LPAVHGPLGPRHVVAVTAAGETLFDGCPVDGAGLRERVDALGMATEGWLDLRPEAEAPWPLVDEALATFAKAAVPAFRLDNAPFRHMNDAVAVYGEPKAPPPLPLGLAPTVRRPAADCAAEALVRIR